MAAVALLAVPQRLPAQSSQVLGVAPPRTMAAKRGTVAEARLAVELRSGYHVNSDTPSEEYLIPLRLTWSAAPLEAAGVTYPKAKMEKYDFADKPLSVFSGDFEIVARFKVPASAAPGPAIVVGKLRYQACTSSMCLPPKTVEVRLPVDVR
jgi:thioredoxin:protein disulfide reductase